MGQPASPACLLSSAYGLNQLLHFAWQQALACLFPLLLFLTFVVTKWITLPGLARGDLILLVCLVAQYALYRTGLETRDELKVIAVFHLAGLCLELAKTQWHCWSYPESGWARIAGVPLYSGFMYATVASYLCSAWRRLEVRLDHWPRTMFTGPLAAAIYLNFFSEHWLPDIRWVLTGLIALVFRRATALFVVRGVLYRLPMCAAFGLIGFFLWVAENVATFFGAWQYPNQHGGWHFVTPAKISSWSLLVIFSFLIVAHLKHVKQQRTMRSSSAAASGVPECPVSAAAQPPGSREGRE